MQFINLVHEWRGAESPCTIITLLLKLISSSYLSGPTVASLKGISIHANFYKQVHLWSAYRFTEYKMDRCVAGLLLLRTRSVLDVWWGCRRVDERAFWKYKNENNRRQEGACCWPLAPACRWWKESSCYGIVSLLYHSQSSPLFNMLLCIIEIRWTQPCFSLTVCQYIKKHSQTYGKDQHS